MTKDERQLLLELAGTIEIMLRRIGLDQTHQDFEQIVEPLRARVFDRQQSATSQAQEKP